MPTTTDLALVDTNVLVYSFYENRPEHAASVRLRDRARSTEAALCLAPQNIAEIYAIITNPKRVSEPFTPADALAQIDRLLTLPGLALLPVPTDLTQRTLALLRDRPITGAKIYDVQLVATMLGNGVRSIFTFNTKDFTSFPELEVSLPPVLPP